MSRPDGGFFARQAVVRDGRQRGEQQQAQGSGAKRHSKTPGWFRCSDPQAARPVPSGAYNYTMYVVRFEAHGRRFRADLGSPVSIAIPLDFAGPQPSCFDAPRADARPLRAGSFVGDTRAGGSCNCEILTLAPHCNGTHTECVGHVTDDRVAVSERVPGGLRLARLVTVAPVAASASAEEQRSGARARRPPAHRRCARGRGCGG